MKKRVLVVSAGLVHPSLAARSRLRAILSGVPGTLPTFTSSVEGLKRLSDNAFDGVVLYFHRRRISDEALSALDRFVAAGGGLFALHGASASFKGTDRYFEILGGRFVGHGKVERYTVSRAAGAGAAFSVSLPFSVTDELYIHRYRDDVTIRYTTETKDIKEPVVWTRSHGKGRVCYLSLGHVAKVLEDASVRQIVADGLSFVLKVGPGVKDG
jgi:type 1 glutamine amidotransferase